MNSYIKLCNQLKNCEKRKNGNCKASNKVKCAKRIIEKHIKGDRDELLKLKAQSRCFDIKDRSNWFMSLGAMAVSIFAIYFSIILSVNGNEILKIPMIIFFLVLLIIIFLIVVYINKFNRKMLIWYEYMNVAIDMLEEKYKK